MPVSSLDCFIILLSSRVTITVLVTRRCHLETESLMGVHGQGGPLSSLDPDSCLDVYSQVTLIYIIVLGLNIMFYVIRFTFYNIQCR